MNDNTTPEGKFKAPKPCGWCFWRFRPCNCLPGKCGVCGRMIVEVNP